MKNTIRLRYVLASLIVLAAILSACQPSAGPVPEDFQITFERSPCFGTCPVYSLTVSADGQVVFDGLDFVEELGQQTASLSATEVSALYNAVNSTGFFELKEGYQYPATDLPTATTTVIMDGRTMRVSRYGGECGGNLDIAPNELCRLEALLDVIPIANGWVAEE